MKRQAGGKRRRTRKLFLLQQILPMRPYVVQLMKDLRGFVQRQFELHKLAGNCRTSRSSGSQADYAQRRRRHDALAELERIEGEKRLILREFQQLGVRVGNAVRGEMLFPCLVDDRDAFFVWYDSEPAPTCWRFRDSDSVNRIPERWFNQYPLLPRKEAAEKWL